MVQVDVSAKDSAVSFELQRKECVCIALVSRPWDSIVGEEADVAIANVEYDSADFQVPSRVSGLELDVVDGVDWEVCVVQNGDFGTRCVQGVTREETLDVGHLVAFAFCIEYSAVDDGTAVRGGELLNEEDVDALLIEESFDFWAFVELVLFVEEPSAVELCDS